jgi:hypothetical protein
LKRRLSNFACGLAFMLFVAMTMAWVRSYIRFDELSWNFNGRLVAVGWSHGRVFAGWGDNYPSFARRGWLVARPVLIEFEHESAGFGYRDKNLQNKYRVRAVAFPFWFPALLLAWPSAVYLRRTMTLTRPKRRGFDLAAPSTEGQRE